MSLQSPALLAFVAIAKHKTVHAAAKSLFLTQTAVTQRIRSLENQLNTTLFIRSRRGMLLTTEGEALLRYCQASQALEGEALAAIQDPGKATEVRLSISAPTSIMQSRIIPSCLAVIHEFKNLYLQFTVNDKNNRHLSLRTGDCDLAIISPEELTAEMEFKYLKPEKYVLVCSSQWQQRSLKNIISQEPIIDFDPSDPVTFGYLKKFNLFKYARYQRHFVNRTEAIAMMVANEIGYSALAKELAQHYLDQQQLILLNQGKTYDLEPVLVWYKRQQPPKYFAAIIDAIN